MSRCNRLTAIEPAHPLRALLARKLERRPGTPAAIAAGPASVEITPGFFDSLPVPDRAAELVIACSALTPDPAQGGEPGLAEMERACAPPGLVVILWPNQPDWLTARGYRYLSFPGEMAMEFASIEEAVELSRVFYPDAVDEVVRRGDRRVPYGILGVNPPRDLAYRTVR